MKYSYERLLTGMTTFAEILDEDIPVLPEDGMLSHVLHLEELVDVVLWCIVLHWVLHEHSRGSDVHIRCGCFYFLYTVPSSMRCGVSGAAIPTADDIKFS
jgi:hypothetical protein